MRRYTFYLSVALLAFGIGSFVVFNFFWKTENALPKVQDKLKINTFTKGFGDARSDLRKNIPERQVENELSDEKRKTTFICKDKILSSVLRDLKNETWFVKESKYFIDEENLSDCNDILFIEKLVDLNKDGKKEAVVRGKTSLFCGATGNCSTWIYGQLGNRYRRFLDTGGETLEVKKSITNGYKNIFVSVHDSCCSSYLKTYKFDGVKYKESNCLFEDYGTTGERNVVTCDEKTRQSQKGLREIQNQSNTQ